MNYPFDDALANAAPELQDHMRKQDRKQATKRSRTVKFSGADGFGDGEASVTTCEDGERHFVNISLHDPYAGDRTVVNVDDNSHNGALARAEERFSDENYGYISLKRADEDDQ